MATCLLTGKRPVSRQVAAGYALLRGVSYSLADRPAMAEWAVLGLVSQANSNPCSVVAAFSPAVIASQCLLQFPVTRQDQDTQARTCWEDNTYLTPSSEPLLGTAPNGTRSCVHNSSFMLSRWRKEAWDGILKGRAGSAPAPLFSLLQPSAAGLGLGYRSLVDYEALGA